MANKKRIEDYALDQATRDFLKMLADSGDQPLSEIPIEQSRADQLHMLKANPPLVREADIEDLIVPGGKGGDISIRIVRPKNNKDELPAVVYFHGGGWVLSGKETHDYLIRELANEANVAIVFVNYAHAPEAQYPTQNEESYKVLEWVADQGRAHQLNPDKIAVAGDSAGGNMATVMALTAKAKQGPKIAFQLLVCPVLDAQFDTPSYHEFASGFMMSRDTMKWFWDQYAPDPSVRRHPTASPLQASIDELKGLPPALIITAECDVLRDEAEAYALKLSHAGVEVITTRYVGTIHNFMSSMALGQTPAAKAAIRQVSAQLMYYLRVTTQPYSKILGNVQK